jgi:beta-lactamase class A
LTAGLTLSLRDACYLMTVLSDNTATNMVIDRFGMEAINTRIRALGFTHTTLLRRAFTPETAASRQFGLGVTTAREMGHLLGRLARKEIGNEKVSADILTILAAQQDRAAIPRYLPEGWQYAGKTGCIKHLRGDVGIVTAPDGGQYILALFCSEIPAVNWTVDNFGLLTMAQLSRALLRV